MSVTDGDTIAVLYRGRAVSIRLAGIDCPEKKQAFGSRAKQFTSDLVYNKAVRVEPRGYDRYHRVIGDVYFEDHQSLNRELIKAGFAWWYRKYSEDETLQKLESEANSLLTNVDF